MSVVEGPLEASLVDTSSVEPAPIEGIPVGTQVNTLHAIDKAIEEDVRDGWKAELTLAFTQRGDKTVLKHRHQSGPLAIQRPLYPDGTTCHTYLLHPPGGVVGGDTLTIHVTVKEHAHTLITTPGSTKFYRSNNRYAQQKQTLCVESGARLEWFPQDNIFFPHAHVRLDTDIYLDTNAQFWGWELHCYGRPALDEAFTHGHLVGKTRIFIDQSLVLTEGLQVTGGDQLLMQKGLLNFPLMGTLYIRASSSAAEDETMLERVQAQLAELQMTYGDRMVMGVTEIEGLLVIRALAYWSEDVIAVFSTLWQSTRHQITGITPDKPRIWAT